VPDPFQYLVLRLVPDVERGEQVNVGVALHCRTRGFLGVRAELPQAKALALSPGLDVAAVRAHLAVLRGVAAGDPAEGRLAQLPPSERFGWLAAPSSTVVQPSPVHTGLCRGKPADELDRLFERLVGGAGATPDLGALRESYALGGLDESDLAGDWLTQAQRWTADAIASGVHEPNAMVLATADAGARPSARTVLLKGLDERGFTLFTNRTSRKGRQALANPHAALVLAWVPLQRQVLVTGTIAPIAAEESDAYFASRPYGSRLGAAASPQSQVVADRGELVRARDALAAAYPEGAHDIPRPPEWGGLRVSPETVEFWQGRPDRLHDRLRYRRTATGAWVVERLAP
jgi:pyridoxamine 5'-phosphate oxidase